MVNELTPVEDFPVNQLEIDYSELKLVNFDSLMDKAKTLQKTYSNLIITDEKDLINLRGRDSVLSKLRKIRNTIDTARKDYNKEIKKRSAYPREQLVELTQVLDDTINSLNDKINEFEQEEINNREKRLEKMFNEVLSEGEKELIPTGYEKLFTFEMFYKERFTNKSNHVNKMSEKGKRKFIIEWFNLNIEAIQKMNLTAERFTKGNNLSLVEDNVKKQIIALISQQLNVEEKVDPDRLKSDLFDWLNDQLEIFQKSVIAQNQEQENIKKEREKLEEEKQKLKEEKDNFKEMTENKGGEANGGEIIIDDENEEVKSDSQEHIYNLTIQATESQVGAVKEALIKILGSDKFLLDRAK